MGGGDIKLLAMIGAFGLAFGAGDAFLCFAGRLGRRLGLYAHDRSRPPARINPLRHFYAPAPFCSYSMVKS